ncbi:MAG: hypothetical protein WCE90_01555 [Candidatus Zixiibacteriota bacterium]
MFPNYNNGIVDDELHVAEKFVNYLNQTYIKDFVLPSHPVEDRGIDALTQSKSNPAEILKMQIVSSDFKAKEQLGKEKTYEPIRDRTQKIMDTIVNPILHKSLRYSPDFKKDIVLVLDGWWTVRKEDLDYFKTHCLNSYLILEDAGFKEIWFVSMKDGGPIYKLFPLLS